MLAPVQRPLATLSLLFAVACSGSNEPSVMTSNATTTGGAGKASAPTESAGGSSAATTPSSGSTSAGRAASSSAATSSSAAAGSSAAASSSSGSGGATASSAAASSGEYSPLCSAVPQTAAGEAPTKGGACTESDPQLCYKTCGPQSVGFKSETCMNGAYVEQSGCSFPDADYACYKIPSTVDASCPSAAPQATMACEVAPCTPCNAGGNYLDSSGAEKPGYCVCPMAGDSGMRKWSCASTTAWPCPSGKGC